MAYIYIYIWIHTHTIYYIIPCTVFTSHLIRGMTRSCSQRSSCLCHQISQLLDALKIMEHLTGSANGYKNIDSKTNKR